MTLSVVIITKNEAANICRCLDSVAFADERIVYDTGSEDGTPEIAAQAGAKVIIGTFDGFGTTKQRAMEHATCDWVLSLDADEEVSPELRNSIGQAFVSSVHSGFAIVRRTLFLGRWIRHGGWYPDVVTRLARRNQTSFSSRLVHEGMIVNGTVGRLSGDLLHYSYPTIDGYLKKGDLYTSLGASQIASQRSITWYDFSIRPWWQFFRQYLLQLGFLDGWQGFVLASLSSMQVLIKYTKARMIQQSGRES